MNERIRKLHNQACRLDMEHYPNAIPDGERIQQKFADLIVWECMVICEDVMKKDNSALTCWSEIKRTFRS